MKIYKVKKIPAVNKSVVDKTICDICKNDVYDVGEYNSQYSEMYMKQGDVWPEGGQMKGYEVDLCVSCFENRLVPWLRSQGAELDEIVYDY